MRTLMAREHLLRQLNLPDRYERLSARLGPEVVQILVPPEEDIVDGFERLALAVQTRDEGVLVPAYGESGVGKTTLLDNLTYFLPQLFTQTLNYAGEITYDSLEHEAKEFICGYPPNERRVLPINIDHRENAPPNDRELAEMKRFLRVSSLSIRPVILWPDTNIENTKDIANRYSKITGKSPVSLPFFIQGPRRETWIDIARNTLRMANDIVSLEDLGVDPGNYDPSSSSALGAFLRDISTSFTRNSFPKRKSGARHPYTGYKQHKVWTFRSICSSWCYVFE
jgi:energy-coupling factor transporter ATP-binding protein EcfA2